MRYETFELTVSRSERAGRYRLLARSTTQGEAEAGTRIDLAGERLPEMAELRKRATTAAELENLGTALYRSLFVGEIESLWKLSFGEVSRNPELGCGCESILPSSRCSIVRTRVGSSGQTMCVHYWSADVLRSYVS